VDNHQCGYITKLEKRKEKEKKNLITLLTLQIQEPFHLSQYTPKQMDKKDVQMSGLVPNEQLLSLTVHCRHHSSFDQVKRQFQPIATMLNKS
jgi:hypothetical protein